MVSVRRYTFALTFYEKVDIDRVERRALSLVTLGTLNFEFHCSIMNCLHVLLLKSV